VAKDAQGRVGIQLSKAKGPSRKTGIVQVQFTLSQGKIKKEDDLADDEDDDWLRTSVSQDQVAATLCTD
jgi:hypothetical protein